MKILFCGDVVGRAGRARLVEQLPELRAELALDAIIVNGENAAGGFGITPSICREFYDAGTDVITTGNHVFDQRELVGYIGEDRRLIRPLNMQPSTPGRGSTEITLADGRKLLVLQVMGRLRPGVTSEQVRGNLEGPFRSAARAGPRQEAVRWPRS